MVRVLVVDDYSAVRQVVRTLNDLGIKTRHPIVVTTCCLSQYLFR